MAKKKIDDFDDRLSVDSGLDFPDFEMDDFEVKDDRKPVIRVAAGIADGVKAGLKDSTFIRQSIKDILPRGYGQSMDLGDEVVGSMRSVAREATTVMRPAIAEIKKASAKLIPKESKLVPKSIQNLLQRWREEETSNVATPTMQREAMLSSQLTDIFGETMKQNVDQHAQQEGNDRLKEGIELSRYKDTTDLQTKSYGALKSIDQYNRQINLPVQKKTIELLHQQLFVQQDTLTYLQQANKRRDELLATINKNTALPDFVKINKKENLHQIVRNKFYDSANNGLFGDRNAVVQKITGNMRNKVMDTVTGAVSGIRTGLGQADQLGDMIGGDAGDSIDKHRLAGSIAGSVGANYLGSKLGFKLRDKLKDSWVDRKLGIIDKGNSLENGMNNIPQKINKFRNDDSWDFDDSLKGKGIRLLQALVPNMQSDMTVNRLNARNLDDPTSFSKKTDRSINEIIPGFLSRILREIQIFRTGEASTELIEFDALNGKFTSKGKNDLNSFRSIVNPANVKATQDRLTDIEKFIDTDDKLSTAAKSVLRKTLLMNSGNLRESNGKTLGNKNAYAGADDNVAEEASAHMTKFFENMSSEQKLQFTRMSNGLINDVGESRGAIQQQLNLGRAGQLEKLGMLSDDGKSISMEGILKHYLDANNAKGIQKPVVVEPNRVGPAAMDLLGGIGDRLTDAKNSVVDKVKHYKQLGFNGTFQEVQDQAVKGANDLYSKIDQDKLKANWTQGHNATYAHWDKTKQKAKTFGDAAVNQYDKYKDIGAKKTALVRDALKTSVLDLADNKIKGLKQKATKAYSTSPTIPDVNLNPNLATAGERTKRIQDILPTGALNAIDSVKDVATKLTDQTKQTIVEQKEKFSNFKVIRPPIGIKPESTAPVDIYVQGEEEPRLRAALMLAGEYADRETGETIFSSDEIKGDVVDREQRIVLSGFELPKLMTFKERIGNFVPLRLLGALSNPIVWLAKKAWAFQTKVAPKMVAFNYRLTKKAFGVTSRFAKTVLGMNGPPLRDVYITGEPEPRLTAVGISAGVYRHKHSNEILTHQDKIEGTIINEDNQIVIDESELENLQVYNSIFNVYNPLKLIPKAIKGIGKLLKGFQTKVAPKIMAFNMGLVKKVGSLTSKLFGLGPIDVCVKGDPKVVLLGKDMADGKYFSRNTGKVIKTPNDIDGAVVDDSGEILLSEKDLSNGITRSNGKPISSSFFKGVKNIISGVKKFFSVRTGLKLKAPRVVVNEKLGDDLNKIKPLKNSIFAKQNPEEKQVSLLQSLVNMAKEERLEKAKEKLLGPNGERVNSFKDKFKKKKTIKEDKKDDKKEKESSGMLGKLGKLFGGLFGKKEEDSGGGGLLSLASKFMMGGGGVAAGAAAGAGATAVASGAAASTAAATAAAGATVATTGGLAAGATTLGVIGGGILSFLASPIVLGAAALALGGYGVYKGYKCLTRGNMTPVERVRYVQYGFRVTETKHAAKVLALEKALLPYLKLEGKNPTIDEKAIKIETLMDPFDLDTGNKEEVQLFFRWYQNRFKPVFLTHVIVISSLKGKPDISLANSLKAEELKEYLNSTRFSNGPYRSMDLPILEKDVQASSAGDVEQVVNDAISVLGDTKTSDTKLTEKKPIEGKDNLPKDGLTQVSFNPNSDASGKKVGDYNPLNGTAPTTIVTPDSEPMPAGSVAGAVGSTGSMPNQSLKMAGGPLSDGRNAANFIQMAPGATIDRLNPAMLKNFYAMADEYGTTTGKKIKVNDGYRSFEQQVALKKKLGDQAAEPGKSLHGFGLAMDVDQTKLNELEAIGLMRKYGFTRPVGAEPWHMEPAGIQGNLDGYKRNQEAATAAIAQGVGLGGGGYGTVSDARKYGRNKELAMSLLSREVKPNIDNKVADDTKMASVTPSAIPDTNKAPMPPGSVGFQKVAYAPDAEAQGTVTGGTPMRAPTVANTGTDPTGKRGVSEMGVTDTSIGDTNPQPTGKASDVPQVKGSGYSNVKDTINQAARVVGYDPDRLTKVIAVESSFNPSASAGPGGAEGLGQFLNKTWTETTGKYGSKYGVNPGTPRTDGRANALMTAHYLQDGEKVLKGSLNRPITAVDNYFAHFLGPYGAKKFLEAVQSDPKTIGSNLLPAAANNNRGIFFNNSTARTVSEIYQTVADRINNKVKSFGITPDKTPPVMNVPEVAPSASTNAVDTGIARPTSVKPTLVSDTPSTYAGQSKTALANTPSSFAEDQSLPIQAPKENVFSNNMPIAPKPLNTVQQTTPTNNVIKIDGSVFGTTERLLSESLEVHKQVLNVLTQMLGSKPTTSTTQTDDKTKPAPIAPSLKIPSSVINMKRQA